MCIYHESAKYLIIFCTFMVYTHKIGPCFFLKSFQKVFAFILFLTLFLYTLFFLYFNGGIFLFKPNFASVFCYFFCFFFLQDFNFISDVNYLLFLANFIWSHSFFFYTPFCYLHEIQETI